MSAKEIGTYIGNGLDKAKDVILSIFGKTGDAFNDYDVTVNVTEHGKGPDAEPTGTRVYHNKYKVYIGNVVLAAIGVATVLAIILGIKSLIDKD